MKKKFLVLIALTFILTACSSKPKQEEIKDNKKKITTENKKELKIQNAPMFSNFKVINKNNKEFIKADIKNDKDKIKTLKVLDTFKIPFTKQKESVEFLRSLWDLKYKKEIVEKIEKEVKAIKDIKKIKEIAKEEEKKSNESKNLVKDEKELAQKSEIVKKEAIKETKKVVETKSQKIVETKRETEKEIVKERKKEIQKPKQKVWVVDVKKQDPVYENKCIITKEAWTETTDELISADRIIKPRWFVKTDLGTEYFYSSKEAENRSIELLHKGYTGNWGTAEDEVIITNKKYKTINHPEEKSCKKVLIKEGVKEKGHWEYR